MNDTAVLAVGRHGEQLRYVTEHFQDLQGLRLAPFWAYVLISVLFERVHRPDKMIFLILVGGLLLLAVSWVWVGRWYRNRYGLVMKPVAQQSYSRAQAWLGVIVIVIGTAIGIEQVVLWGSQYWNPLYHARYCAVATSPLF